MIIAKDAETNMAKGILDGHGFDNFPPLASVRLRTLERGRALGHKDQESIDDRSPGTRIKLPGKPCLGAKPIKALDFCWNRFINFSCKRLIYGNYPSHISGYGTRVRF